MLGQQRHQLAAAHQRRGRGAHQLAHRVAAQHRTGLHLDVVGAERGVDGARHDVVAHLEFPGHGFAGGCVAKSAAAVLRQVVDAGRRPVARDVRRRCAHDELQREQPPRHHAALRWVARAEAHIHAVFHPVADAVVQLHIGLHQRVAAAELVEHRPDHLQQDGARRHDAQRPRHCLTPAPRTLHRLLQCGQARLCGGQELPPFFGEAQAACGAVEQPHAQVRFELHQQLAGRLWRDALRGRRLAQAAQLGGLGKVGDGAQFIDGHGGQVLCGAAAWWIGKRCLRMNPEIMG